jgi:SAM-dependent methyltransferase
MITGGGCLEPDWDRRYREAPSEGLKEAHELVRKHASLMNRDKTVIDVAAGTGRDLLFLARRGFRVCGLEKSREAIRLARGAADREGLHIWLVRGDALFLPFREGKAGAVLVFYFLERAIMNRLVELLAPGGLMLYETFLRKQNELDRKRDPAFLLEDGELPGYFHDLETLSFEEGVFDVGGRQRAIARYAGRKK